eukprot:gnl/Chilomastix_caulleri/563.p1 GENE.gnl/Chilomastix_caulleri/563~~gnl/Chilomastix_caulleri/563.p1  ORF type:complete len:253 (+),score=92.61 gnl/Chilomastix_caulleri/563:115-873(+)
MPRIPLVGGNWKCNGTLASVKALCEVLNKGSYPKNVEVVVSPAMPHVHYAKTLISEPVQVAAQNIFGKGPGAYTGETCCQMLLDMHVNWVILGHSERRSYIHETEDEVAEKTAVAIRAGLNVIFCIGETLEQREKGEMETVLFAQIDALTKVLEIDEWRKVVIAYEPVWAIGTGKVATVEQAQEAHSIIRKHLEEESKVIAEDTRILYGGSVNAANSRELASCPDIDGFLVGGASLKPEFLTIVENVSAVKM